MDADAWAGDAVERQRPDVVSFPRAAELVPDEVSALPEGGSGRGLLHREAVYKRALAAIDVLAGAAALTVARLTVGHGRMTIAALLTLPLIVVIARLSGLYHRDQHVLHKTTLEEAPALFQAATLFSLLTWLSADLTFGSALSPAEVVAIWGLLFSLMVVGRAVSRSALGQIIAAERCLVVGDARSAGSIERKLRISVSLKATVIGRIPIGSERWVRQSGGPPVLGTLDRLAEVVMEHDIDRVIVVPSASDDSFAAIRLLKALGVRISVLPRLFEVIGSSFVFDDVDGMPLVGIRSARLTRSTHVLKRTMDLIVAAIALVGLAPLFGAISVAIKLTSPGPLLYRQRRIGRDGLEFDMLKFRSMVDGADAQKKHLLTRNETEGLFKITDDPRITRVGRFLRKSSLDELPQIWNVIRGEMSLVGPRPLVRDDDARIEGWHRDRLELGPGMTGPWQIVGSTRAPLEEMVKLDYLYGATWSLWLDMKILIRTVTYMAAGRSA